MTVSILLPTCYRLELLKRTIDRFLVTTSQYDPQFVCVVDEDEQSFEYLKNALWGHDLYLHFNPKRIGPNAAWNQALTFASEELLFIAGDDSYPEDGWLDEALEAHLQMGSYGFVGLNDGRVHGNTLMTTPFFDKRFCRDVLGGVVFCPEYIQYFCDNENHYKAIRSGHWRWEEKAVVRHQWDEVPQNDWSRIRGRENWAHDEQLFNHRSMQNFPITWEPLI